MEYKNPIPISKKLTENYEYLNDKLGFDVSFDVGYREIFIKSKKVHIYYVTGLCDTNYIIELIKGFLKLGEDDVYLHKDAFDIIHNHIVFQQVNIVEDMEEVITNVLAGLVAVIVDDFNKAFIIDVRNYPGRGPAEPDTEKVIRGSHDGFTENIVINTALTRRRMRDPDLRNEIYRVGKYSKMDVCLSYIKGIADDKIVNEVRKRIKNIEADEITMTDKKLEELIIQQKWNPYPKVRYTERPDTLAVHLYQGLVAIYVDTSPSVIIAPTTYFEQLQHVEEHRQTPVVGSFLRLIRTGGILLSIFLVPLWLLFVQHPEYLPEVLKFIGEKEHGNVPVIWQIMIAEVGIEFLRLAAVHTPTSLSTAMGIVAAILIGQIAIDVGMFSPEIVLYVAVSSVGSYATPSYELSLANKIATLIIIIFTFFFDIWGIAGSTGFIILFLTLTKSFGKPYFYPVIPFNLKEFINIFIRVFATEQKERKQKSE
ncbi:MAG: stage sporulation protein [Haloplasmataceae bacterium]|nr:stage sporulation protein [Haloplasmataceae bacterium]